MTFVYVVLLSTLTIISGPGGDTTMRGFIPPNVAFQSKAECERVKNVYVASRIETIRNKFNAASKDNGRYVRIIESLRTECQAILIYTGRKKA